MKKAIAKLVAGYRKLVATPYDVDEHHAYSKKSIEEQRVIQNAAAFFAEKTQKSVGVIDNAPLTPDGVQKA